MAIAYQKVLLTGGSGYVGRKFLERLSHRTNMIVDRLGRSVHDDIQWHSVGKDDLVDVEIVYHLAGSTDLFSLRDDAEAHRRANVQLTETLFNLFLDSDASLFVYMSTAKVMGEGRVKGYRIAEMPSPETAYSRSKYEAECRLQQLWSDYRSKHPNTNKWWVVIRPSMIYGSDNRGSLWSLWRWIGRGRPVLREWQGVRRSMVSIESVLDVLEAIPSTQLLFPRYFLADMPTLSMGEVMYLMSDHHNRRLRFWHLPGYLRTVILALDRIFFSGRIAWQLRKLEQDFVVEGEGIWGVMGTEMNRMSVKCLDDTLLRFRLQGN